VVLNEIKTIIFVFGLKAEVEEKGIYYDTGEEKWVWGCYEWDLKTQGSSSNRFSKR